MKKKQVFRFSLFLVTIGIVYGDIGTSPLYVMKSILEGNGGLAAVDEAFDEVAGEAPKKVKRVVRKKVVVDQPAEPVE